MAPIEIANTIFKMIGEMKMECWIPQFIIKNNELIRKNHLNTFKYANLSKHFENITFPKEIEITIEPSIQNKIGHLIKWEIKLNEYGEPFQEDVDYEDECIIKTITLIKTYNDDNNYTYVYIGDDSSNWFIFNRSNNPSKTFKSINGIILTNISAYIEPSEFYSYWKWNQELKIMEYIVDVDYE